MPSPRVREPEESDVAAARAPDLARRVEESALESAPFPHVYLENIFPPAYYSSLLDYLPATPYYRELRHRDAMQSDGHSARRKFYLYPEHIVRLPAAQRHFWLELSRALRSRRLQDAFKRKFRRALEQRFGRSVDRLSFYPVAMLLQDLPGYRIGIHGDSLRKALTVQLYLPRDHSQRHLGTVLHESRDGSAAEKIKRLPFSPASGYALPVLYHESWHSVVRTGPGDGVRNSIMLTYYVQERLLDRVVERLKRCFVFFAYWWRV